MIRRLASAPATPFAALAAGWLLTWLRVATPAALHDPSVLYWRGWQDQSLYVRSATALARGDFAASEHWYPLLYPLLGTPFVGLWPSQPFFIANLACYLLAFAGFRRVAAAFGVRRWPAAAIFAATTLVQFVFAKPWIEPWTTTASAALLWLAFGMATRLWTEAMPKRREAAILGIAVALTPFARPGDAPIALIAAGLGLAAALRAPCTPPPRRGVVLTAFLAGGTAFALAAIPWLLVYGPGLSPYMLFSARYGFNFAWLGWKAYVILVDPHAWFGGGTGLLKVAPWLILGAAGLVQACVTGPRDRRVPAIALSAAAALYTCLMLAYVDLLPTGLWRYNNVHYFKWLLPLFGLFAVRFVIVGARRPATLASIVPFLLLLCVKIVPVPVGADDPARLLIFSQPRGSVWSDLYFATAWITDAHGEQRNSFDYHQILDPAEVRTVALRRPFAGDERWIGDERIAAQLAGTDTGGYAPLYLTGPWPRTPLRRYGARVTLGWPSALF
ncbi:hypothetical protein PX554_03625 [Sphingomonas sp. H39-1-10]|uniref:hypothetical protein n=1 Tax=Sphingomonas pollutisoli TaxID=3030829 RepID=UPI0023B9178A|nr:hypothetical protein [Sphingomonas pollutisoli]MDF0487209.1 hypothetical protein [Sphingomonas pollutisoli]